MKCRKAKEPKLRVQKKRKKERFINSNIHLYFWCCFSSICLFFLWFYLAVLIHIQHFQVCLHIRFLGGVAPFVSISTDHILAHFWQLMVTPSCDSVLHWLLSSGWHISPRFVRYRYTAQRCLIGRWKGGRDAECFILLLILVLHVNYQMLVLKAARNKHAVAKG